MSPITRRNLIRGAAGLGGAVALGGLAGCGTSGSPIGPHASAIAKAEAARRRGAGSMVSARLAARRTTVDLGGLTVATWAFGDTVPGPVLQRERRRHPPGRREERPCGRHQRPLARNRAPQRHGRRAGHHPGPDRCR